MINIELISPEKNAAVVRSVNGETGDVVLEIPSIEGLATVEYVDQKASDVDLTGYATEQYVNQKVAEAQMGGDVSLDDYALKSEVPAKVSQLENDAGYITAEDIPPCEGGPDYIFGEGLGYNEQENVIFLRGDDTVYFPYGVLSVNQDSLFTSGGFECVAESFWDEFKSIFGEVWSVNVIKMKSPDDVQWFFENARGKTVITEVILEDGWFNANGEPVYFTNAQGADGVMYDVLLDMRDRIEPYMREEFGVIGIQIGYVGGEAYFIVQMESGREIHGVRGVRIGESNIRRSLAHNYVGSYDHFRVENEFLYLNEDYIYQMIDRKISDIPRAEEVSV